MDLWSVDSSGDSATLTYSSSSVTNPDLAPPTKLDLKPAGVYRLPRKQDDDDLHAGVPRSKPVKKQKNVRRKLSMVSISVLTH